MKKIIIAIFLTITITLSAQNVGLESVSSSTTDSLITNPLDHASGVGKEFSMLDNSYLFGGLTNMELGSTLLGTETYTSNPMWLGYYHNADNPWSIFTGFTAVDSTFNIADDTTYTAGAPETVVDGTSSTDHQWNSQSVDTVYSANKLFDSLNFAAQYLFMFGDINTGLYFSLDIVDVLYPTDSFTETEENFYNAAGAGVIPVATADYTRVRTETDADGKDLSFAVGIPFYMALGSLGTIGNVTFNYNNVDTSTTMVEAYTGTPDTAIGTVLNTEESENIDTLTTLSFGGSYDVIFRGFGSDNRNALTLGGDITGGFEIPEASVSLITQSVDYAGGGAAAVIGQRDEDTSTTDFQYGTSLDFIVNASNSFYFDLGSMVLFIVKPFASFGIKSESDALQTKVTDVVNTDTDTNGVFTDAVDTKVTTIQVLENTNIAGSDASTVTTLTTTLELPMALTVAPNGWLFSLTLGSTPSFICEYETTETKSGTTETTVTTLDGTGAETGSTVDNSLSSDTSTLSNTDYTVEATHNLSLTVPVGDSVTFDVSLDASSGTSNILEFAEFAVQVIIALP